MYQNPGNLELLLRWLEVIKCYGKNTIERHTHRERWHIARYSVFLAILHCSTKTIINFWRGPELGNKMIMTEKSDGSSNSSNAFVLLGITENGNPLDDSSFYRMVLFRRRPIPDDMNQSWCKVDTSKVKIFAGKKGCSCFVCNKYMSNSVILKTFLKYFLIQIWQLFIT